MIHLISSACQREPCAVSIKMACELRSASKPIPVHMWPLALYFVLVVLLVITLLGLSFLLGQRHVERATPLPYESGVVSTGSARLRFGASFYLIAVFFLIFDLEAAFLFAWSVALRDIGWAGYCAGVVFIGVLFVALAYLWRGGALDFAPRRLPRVR